MFVGKLPHTLKHAGVLDHHVITVRVICDRGVSHEIVRHRIAAYLQESTRYCDYAKAGQIGVIDIDEHMTPEQLEAWLTAMIQAEQSYNRLRELGCAPQIARSVLPNSLKTEIIMSLPIALRMVYEAAHSVKLPVIGLGGISTAEDAVEFLLAGAVAVGVGTANFWDPCACENLVDALERWCLEHRVQSIRELVGGLITP